MVLMSSSNMSKHSVKYCGMIRHTSKKQKPSSADLLNETSDSEQADEPDEAPVQNTEKSEETSLIHLHKRMRRTTAKSKTSAPQTEEPSNSPARKTSKKDTTTAPTKEQKDIHSKKGDREV